MGRDARWCWTLGFNVGLLLSLGGARSVEAETLAATAVPKDARLLVLPFQSTNARGDSVGVGAARRNALISSELQRSGYTSRSTWDKDARDFDAVVGLEPTVEEVFCRTEGQFTCRTSVRWTLIDGASKQPVYRVMTRASSTGEGGDAMAEALIKLSLESLLKRDGFRTALRPYEGATTAPEAAAPTQTQGLRRCTREDAAMPKQAKKVIASTVMVESGNSVGAGTIISPDGFVLTAAHVLQTGESIKLQLPDGKKYPAKEIRRSEHRDVALLYVADLKDQSCMPLRKTPAETGESIYAIGSPLGRELSFSISRGIVSGMRTLDGVSLLQTDASVNPGNSGGPLVDENGNLLGVVDFKVVREEVQGLAFAVAAGDALSAMQLHLDDSTDPDVHRALVASTSTTPKAKMALVVDKDDPPFTTKDRAQYSYGTSRGARTLQVLGASATGVGLVGIGTTWLLYEAGKSSSMSQSEFNSMRTWNDVSWVLTFVGLAGIGGSFLIREDQGATAQTQSPQKQWYAAVGPKGVVVGGAL
jgi:S1-C subfamily serine protease